MKDFILKYWIEAAFGFLVTIIGCGFKYHKKRLNEQELIKLGVMALLRTEIVRAYNEYTIKGVCPVYSREAVESLYKQYHALGGNGTVTDLYEKILDLPTTLKTGDLID